MSRRGDQTRALNGEPCGDSIDAIMLAIYSELRGIVAPQVAAERGGLRGRGTDLSLTRVVHDVWIKLARTGRWESRAHFYGAASCATRQVLVSEARAAAVRGRRVTSNSVLGSGHPEGGGRVTEQLPPARGASAEQILALEDALCALAAADERWARVAEMKLFGDLPDALIAECLGVSVRTVERHWAFGRRWLGKRALEPS